jgi:hypothetical protein
MDNDPISGYREEIGKTDPATIYMSRNGEWMIPQRMVFLSLLMVTLYLPTSV